jgi:hypothetical protein
MCLVVVLVIGIIFDATSLLPAVSPINHGILPPLDGNTRQRDGDHRGGIPPTACGSTANFGGSSGRSGGGGRGGGGDSKWRMMRPLSPFFSLEALAKESTQKKEKTEKIYFYLRQQLLRKTNLDPIFSESRFGTITNKKKITAGTRWGEIPIHQGARGELSGYLMVVLCQNLPAISFLVVKICSIYGIL